MSIVEIMDIKLHRQPTRLMRGFGFDVPTIGTRHPPEAVELRGWVVGGETAAVAVEVVAGSETLSRAETGYWRLDIANRFPAMPNAERSGFQTRLNLAVLPPVFELAIYAALVDGNRRLIATIRGRRFVESERIASASDVPQTDTLPESAAVVMAVPVDEGSEPRVAIVIPVHNQKGLTHGCLEALFGKAGTRIPFEVIVVDDGSSDGTPEVVASFGDRVRMVRLDPNAGFASACNAGAAVSRAEHIVFLNNDTIPHPGWLDALVAHADAHPEAAIVGAKLLYPDGTVQHAGISFIPEGYPHHLYAGFAADHPAVNHPRPMQAVTAACCLVRASVFRALGGFDRTFVNGWEDTDLCLRAGAAGHQVHYCPDSVVLHLESATRDGASPREIENRRRWAERWLGRVRSDCLEFWIADRLVALDLLGPRYPVRLRLAPELAVRGLPPLFTSDPSEDRAVAGDQVHPARTAYRPFRRLTWSKRTARRVATRAPVGA